MISIPIIISLLLIMRSMIITFVVNLFPLNYFYTCLVPLHFTSVPSTAFIAVLLPSYPRASLGLSRVVVQLLSIRAATLMLSASTYMIGRDLYRAFTLLRGQLLAQTLALACFPESESNTLQYAQTSYNCNT